MHESGECYSKHANFGQSIVELSNSFGFEMYGEYKTYHQKGDSAEQRKLSSINSMTSIVIRTQPDCVLVKDDVCLWVEFKTAKAKNDDLFIELVPALINKQLGEDGVNIIYVIGHDDPKVGLRAFCASDMPTPKMINVPTLDTPRKLRQRLSELIEKAGWSKVYVSPCSSNGSNDPYMIIGRDDLLKMKTPQELFEEFSKSDKKCA